MEIIYITHPHQLKRDDLHPTIMALGFFDGVHLGHQQVIQTAKQLAASKGVNCSVMTFSPHPKEILSPAVGAKAYITPLKDKIEQIEALQVDRLYVVNFDIPFSKLTPQQFVDDYLIGLHAIHVVAGFDYTYGSLGKGTMETLPFHSRGMLEHTTVEKVQCQHEKISSTRIRSLLLQGNVQALPELLGRNYSISGTVIDGEKRGRTIGFPTANIGLSDNYILPKVGVYAVTLKTEGRTYKGVCNIGYKPTFHVDKADHPSIEVHLFDFSGDLYGKTVSVDWCFFIRGEQRFESVHELVAQIEQDKETAKGLLFCQSMNN